MNRKNKDWSISLDEGVTSNKIKEGFFEECGMTPYSHASLNCILLGIVPHTDRYQGVTRVKPKHFKLPSQWKEAKEYICEECSILEEGRWYKFVGYKFRVHAISDNSVSVKNLMYNSKNYEESDDFDGYGHNVRKKSIELTQEELKEHLIACAKARGYEEGNFHDLKDGERWGVTKGSKNFEGFCYKAKENSLTLNCGILYKDGKWAEIVKNELPEINGHEGKIDGDEVIYGCAKFDIKFFKLIQEGHCYSNVRDIKSITLDSGVIITMKQIEQIIKAWEAKQ